MVFAYGIRTLLARKLSAQGAAQPYGAAQVGKRQEV